MDKSSEKFIDDNIECFANYKRYYRGHSRTYIFKWNLIPCIISIIILALFAPTYYNAVNIYCNENISIPVTGKIYKLYYDDSDCHSFVCVIDDNKTHMKLYFKSSEHSFYNCHKEGDTVTHIFTLHDFRDTRICNAHDIGCMGTFLIFFLLFILYWRFNYKSFVYMYTGEIPKDYDWWKYMCESHYLDLCLYDLEDQQKYINQKVDEYIQNNAVTNNTILTY